MSTISLINLSLQQYWRELKNTDLRLFLISLILVMTSVTTIQIFTNRVSLVLVRQGSHFIAADQMIRQPVPIPQQWHQKAADSGLESSGYTLFTSMLSKDDQLALTGIKAVESNYPLRGQLKIATEQGAPDQTTDGIPQSGTVWLESALAERLGAKIGDLIQFGATTLKFSHYIRYEPDRNATFFAFIPRAIVHHQDLESAGVLIAGSRVMHVFLYAGDEEPVNTMFDWLEEEKHENARTIDPSDGNQGIGRTLSRADDFLVLAGLLITLLCGIGIALAAQRYTLLRARHIAVYKTLGMTRQQILTLTIVQLIGMLLLAWLISAILGWSLQHLLARLAAGFFNVELPHDFSWLIFFDSLFTGAVAIAAFALFDFIQLSTTPAMHILRASNHSLKKWWSFLPGILGMLILAFLYSDNWSLSFGLFSGIIICWIFASLFTRIIIATGSIGDNFWSLLLARMRKRKMHYGLQTVVFSLCIVFGLMLLLVRTSLLDNWRQQTPENAVNKMLVNIAPDQQQPLADTLQAAGIEKESYYPIVRGRFVRLNGISSEEIAKKNTNRRERTPT